MSKILTVISGDRDIVGCVGEAKRPMAGNGIIEFRGDFEYFWEKLSPLRYRLKSISKVEDC